MRASLGRRAPWLVAALLLTGCMSLPTSGPVTEVEAPEAPQSDVPADIVVRPPQPGESARDIVVHFLEAMEASPISTTVARQFLSEEAAAAWDPELGTIVYSAKSAPSGSSVVSVTLDGAARLDENGRWRGPLSDPTLLFPVAREDGEWRISQAPNALIVRDTWFAQRFTQVSVYYFDPSGQFLVPEPVYLPTGDQLATSLVTDLIAGTGPDLRDVERSFFPASATVQPVTVDNQGRAEVALRGDPAQLTPRAAELLVAQLTWTLRQIPQIQFVDVTVGDQRLPASDTTSGEIPVIQGSQFNPTGVYAPAEPFALREGLLVTGPLQEPTPVAGPFGRLDLGVRSIAVDPRSERVAGVTLGGDRLLVAALEGPADGRVQEVVRGATDLLQPGWDLAGRLWLVDRRAQGALVSVVIGGQVSEVPIRGITGAQVTTFAVSRDGSRLVAVVRTRARDVILQSRIRVTDRGLSGTVARQISFDEQTATRVRDLSWSSPTSLLVLSPLSPGINEVRTLSVDGSPASGLPSGTTLSGNQQWLAGSPVEGETWYAVSVRPPSVLDASLTQYVASLDGVDLRTLTYAG